MPSDPVTMLYTSQYGGGYLSQYLYASATVLTRDGSTWSASGYSPRRADSRGERSRGVVGSFHPSQR